MLRLGRGRLPGVVVELVHVQEAAQPGQGLADPETGTMPDAFADQVRQTLRNVQTILEAAGSSLENVVKVNAYVTDFTRFSEFNEVYKEFFSHDPPARTTVAVGLLGFLVEVDCIAALPQEEQRGDERPNA